MHSIELPTWDLSDLYTSLSDPQINLDIENVTVKVTKFCQDYENFFTHTSPSVGQNTSWQGKDLYHAIVTYEEILEIMGKLASYAGLSYYANLNDQSIQQFQQKIQEVNSQQQTKMVFFILDINNIPEEIIKVAVEQHPPLKKYNAWLSQLRVMKPYQLQPELEKLLIEKNITGRSAWIKLYDETLASISFKFEEEDLPLEAVINLMSSEHSAERKKAAVSLSCGLSSQLNLFNKITNVLAKDKSIDDQWRNFSSPMLERHLDNQVEPVVVQVMYETIKKNYPQLGHRYYKIKAKMLGQEKIEYWDRNAPLPEVEQKQFTWSQSQQLVFQAYNDFSPALAELVKKFFDNPWIDVPIRQGKTSGAFSHPTVPSAHPYILLNFRGKLRDVMTLAHELGHGAHQILAANNGYLLADTPLTLAETASVFGEMLTFQSLLKQTRTPLERKILLAAKIEDMLNTVVRQIAFYDFEIHVHQQRQNGELSIEDLNNLWLQTQKEALGDFVNLDPVVNCFWSYISHFIHVPFYVYAYAFGDCLVNSLYAIYQKNPSADFVENYLSLLKAGGSKRYPELLAPFGFNLYQADFWQGGINVIIRLIDELETLQSHI